MYHVPLTGLTVLLIYLFTQLLCRENFAGKAAVRIFWNFILLISFTITVFAGLTLALQISLKFDLPRLRELLKIHVETGIAFSFTAIIHLIGHSRYFTGKREPASGRESEVKAGPKSSERLPAGNIFALGFITSALQLLVLREIINISGGYELIAGTFFAIWLLLSATGAYQAAGKNPSPSLRVINRWIFLSPSLTLILLMLACRYLMLPGETPGYFTVLILILSVLTPACFFSGYAFVRLSLLSFRTAGRSYATETIGGIAAGISIALVTSGFAGTFTLWVILALSSLLCLYLLNYGKTRSTLTGAFIVVFGILCISTCLLPVDILFRNSLIHGIKIIKSTDSRFGNIAIGDYGGERTVYYNHSIVRYEHDIRDREEGVHFAMLQHPSPKKVLVISGSLQSLLPEIERYGTCDVTFIERDPLLVGTGFSEETVKSGIIPNIIHEDAFRYVRGSANKYDIVLVHLPPPSSLALSRYFTAEFFSDIKLIMNNGAVFACSPGYSSAYINDEALDLFGSVFKTLGLSFQNIVPVEGNRLWLIASDSALRTDFAAIAGERQIKTPYIGGGYISDEITAIQSKKVLENIQDRGKINTLTRPVAGLYYQKFALSRYNISSLLPVLLLAVLIIISLLRGGKRGIAMFSIAAALAGYEMTLLLLLQSTAGNMYHATGIITSSFLGGLAMGSWYGKARPEGTGNPAPVVILTAGYLLFAAAIPLIIKVKPGFITPLLAFLSLIPSFFTGRYYAMAADTNARASIVPVLYGADLTGAALGFLVTSTLTIPLLGMRMTVAILATLVFTGYSLGTILNK